MVSHGTARWPAAAGSPLRVQFVLMTSTQSSTGESSTSATIKPSCRGRAASCSTRGDRDRPTRQAAWPGEEPAPAIQEVKFDDRDEEFVDFVIAQVRKRQEAEDEFYANLADDGAP